MNGEETGNLRLCVMLSDWSISAWALRESSPSRRRGARVPNRHAFRHTCGKSATV
jgi:hypothetical protein